MDTAVRGNNDTHNDQNHGLGLNCELQWVYFILAGRERDVSIIVYMVKAVFIRLSLNL